MTQDEVCAALLLRGAREYRDRTKPHGTRSFTVARLEDVPPCGCNERAPSLCANAYPDFSHPSTGQRFDGSVEFEVCGEAGDGRWIVAKVHGFSRAEALEAVADVTRAAAAVWVAFHDALRHRAKDAPGG